MRFEKIGRSVVAFVLLCLVSVPSCEKKTSNSSNEKKTDGQGTVTSTTKRVGLSSATPADGDP